MPSQHPGSQHQEKERSQKPNLVCGGLGNLLQKNLCIEEMPRPFATKIQYLVHDWKALFLIERPMMNLWLIIAVIHTTSVVVKLKPEKNSFLNGIWTAMTNAIPVRELVTLWVRDIPLKGEECKRILYMKNHIFEVRRKMYGLLTKLVRSSRTSLVNKRFIIWDKTPKHDKLYLRDKARIPSGQDSSNSANR